LMIEVFDGDEVLGRIEIQDFREVAGRMDVRALFLAEQIVEFNACKQRLGEPERVRSVLR